MKKEIRSLAVEFRATKEEDGPMIIRGMPIVYNRDSEDLGFIERIAVGAAKDAIDKSDIRLLYGHNSDTLLPLARSTSGTLRSVETKDGVEMEAELPNTQFAQDIYESVSRGDISAMSFAFTVEDDEWQTRDGQEIRTVTKIAELFDYSLVTYPAYRDTTVALRSLEEYKTSVVAREVGTAVSVSRKRDLDIRIKQNNRRSLI